MAAIYPFRALRPRPDVAARVAAVPYDVVTIDEARALASNNPLSFLHVSRAEIDLPDGIDPYGGAVYERASANFSRLKGDALVIEDEPSLYAYRLRMGAHTQTGLAACFSIDEYERDVIKKHERTRRDKEDDRTRHMIALGAQTGPVFLTYRASAEIDAIVIRATMSAPLFDFVAMDDVQHTVWRIGGADRDALVAAFGRIPSLYIADGHHRAASAARSRAASGASGFLAVAFPHNQVQILPYNRVVKDLGGKTVEAFLHDVKRRFDVAPGPAMPARRGEMAMFLDDKWMTLRPRADEPTSRRADETTRRRADGAGRHAASGRIARTDSRHHRRPNRHAHRFRWRRTWNRRLGTAGPERQGSSRVFAVSRERVRSDGGVRCRRHHAAEEYVV